MSRDPKESGADDHTPLQSILDHLDNAIVGDEGDLKSIIESFGERAFGPVMLLAGLFMMTPLGALPMVPAAFGLIVIIFAVQLLFRRPYPWMPEILSRVKIPARRVRKVKEKVRPVLAKIDRLIHPRMRWVSSGYMSVLIAIVAILLSITLVPLGAIPFAVVPPAFIIGLLGLGITAKDGIVLLVGLTLAGIAFSVIGYYGAGLVLR